MPAGRKTRLRVLRGYDMPVDGHGHAVMITLIRVFGRWSEAATKMVQKHGLTLPHSEVLLCLAAGEGISQQELCERLLFTKGNISVIVKKMLVAALIERRADPVDQRLYRIYLTAAGRRLLAKIAPEYRTLAEQVMKGINQEDQKTFYNLLSRMNQAFDDINS